MKNRVYSKANRRQAVRLYKSGWGYGRIAQVIGCFPSTVKKWIEAAGVPKHSGPKHGQKLRRLAIDWYAKNDVSINAAAKRWNIHPRTLSRWLQEDGVEIRSPKGTDRSAILKDLASGMKRKDIAAKYGCSESWVYRVQSGG